MLEAEMDHRTPLHNAASCGNAEACQYFIPMGAATASRDPAGHSPLDLALMYARLSCVHRLLSSPLPSSEVASNAPAMLLPGLYISTIRKKCLPEPPSIDLPDMTPRHKRELDFWEEQRDADRIGSAHACPKPQHHQSKLSQVTVVLTDLIRLGGRVDSPYTSQDSSALHYACRIFRSRFDLVTFLLH